MKPKNEIIFNSVYVSIMSIVLIGYLYAFWKIFTMGILTEQMPNNTLYAILVGTIIIMFFTIMMINFIINSIEQLIEAYKKIK